ncbi:MAG: hypothetical protein N2053_11430, partial [Chitinispirillaceae bacterium]|nr:hypothetical protein [Chitinispirillaceae bacterium]
MIYHILTTTIGTIESLISLFFSFKRELLKKGRFLLPSLSLNLLFMALLIHFASKEMDCFIKEIWLRGTVSLFILSGLLLLEVTTNFLGKSGINPLFHIGKRRIELRYLWRSGCIFLIIIALFSKWFVFSIKGTDIVLVITKVEGDILSSGIFFCYLLNLYFLEKIFRNTTIIQKRSFISFISASGLVALLAIVGIIRTLYYRTFTIEMLKLYTLIAEICFIPILTSVIRYRMWEEKIEVGRGMIYTSLTVLFFGGFLLLLGCLTLFTKFIGIHFKQIEGLSLIFAIISVGVFLIFSPNMRKTITQISLKYIYKSKYDYRDQFLRLHNIYKESGELEKTIKAFIDNLCYTLIIKDAKVFVFDEIKNYFYLIEEFPTFRRKDFIPKNSKIVELFETHNINYIEIIEGGENKNKISKDDELTIIINTKRGDKTIDLKKKRGRLYWNFKDYIYNWTIK